MAQADGQFEAVRSQVSAAWLDQAVTGPFLFFIRDANGAVLFSGHGVSPAQ